MKSSRSQKREARSQKLEIGEPICVHRCATTVAAVALLVGFAVAGQGTIILKPAQDVRQFDGWILSLMDSSVSETCATTDSRGIEHRVWADSGRVMCQTGKARPVRLSMDRDCSSPLVFERRDAASEPWLVAMWREETDGQVDVMCRYLFRDQWPLSWGPTWNVTIRR